MGLSKVKVPVPPTPVLCFVFAIVVGYFAGRLLSIRDRIRSGRE